ncbi:hypothetical protein Csa_004388, partial [Cucumis sativus]
MDTAGFGPSIVIGSCNPILKDDPKVIEMAEYAVKEQGEDHLILNSVADGQIVTVFLGGNTYYNLLILAHHPRTFQGFYSAIVLENTSKNVKE